jgi:hypothetical protein
MFSRGNHRPRLFGLETGNGQIWDERGKWWRRRSKWKSDRYKLP